jgi:hypothetical protein
MKTAEETVSIYAVEVIGLDGVSFINKDVCVRLMNNYLKDGLVEYTNYLLKNGYCDEDVLGYSHNEPSAIDKFLIFDPVKNKK